MIFTKKKFYSLLDIKNQIVYTPLYFVLLLSFISCIILYTFLSYQEKNKIDLLLQSENFYKKNILKSYVSNIKYNTSASLDDKEIELSNYVFELNGYINSINRQNYSFNIEDFLEYLKETEKEKNVSFLLFDNTNYKILYGKNIIEHLRSLTNSKIRTEKFKNHMLKNIEYIGDQNLIYWIDNKKRDVRLSFFKEIKSKNWFLGSFSKVDDMKKLTKNVILDSIVAKSKTLNNAHFYFYDMNDNSVFNYNGFDRKISLKNIKDFDISDSIVYTFSKYQFKIGIKSNFTQKEINKIKNDFKHKLIAGLLIIIFIALLLITTSNLFGRFITAIFKRSTQRLERRKLWYKKWKDRYELAIIASNDALWDINLNTKEIFFSQKWLDMLGYEEEDIKNLDSWLNLIHKDDKALVLKKYSQHLDSKSEHFVCEYRIKDKSGNYKWILARGKAFHTEDTHRMLMMSMDIDDRMKLSKELRDVELLTEFGRIVIFRWNNDANFSVKFVSKSINTYGYDEKDFMESNINYFDFVHKDDIENLEKSILKAITNDEISFTTIHRVYDKQKNVKWVYNRTILIKDDYGKVIAFFGYLNDITKIKMNEEELKQKVKEELEKNIQKDRLLVQQNKLASMGEMLGNIAHQWRQPLNNINLLMYFIRDNYGNFSKEELHDSINSAKVQIDYMSQTIDDFRNFYQPTKDKKIFLIKDSISRSSKIVASIFERNNIELKIIGEDIKIESYENEFEQVIVNILNNASDAAIVKSKKEKFKAIVKVNVYKNEDQINISLWNNCGNVEQDVIDRMFEPYFTTKFENQGTGIGLYMTKVIVEKNMIGKVEAFNKEEGLEFIISIPS